MLELKSDVNIFLIHDHMNPKYTKQLYYNKKNTKPLASIGNCWRTKSFCIFVNFQFEWIVLTLPHDLMGLKGSKCYSSNK